MSNAENITPSNEIRLGPLRFMHAFTSIIALPLGLVMVLAPDVLTESVGWVLEEPCFREPEAAGAKNIQPHEMLMERFSKLMDLNT